MILRGGVGGITVVPKLADLTYAHALVIKSTHGYLVPEVGKFRYHLDSF